MLTMSAGASPSQAGAKTGERPSPTNAPADAPTLRLDTPSGLPVPRFVSLKSDETNCRIGPSFDHPVRYVFKRAGAPVMVVAESVDHWRKIEDAEGAQCWAHETTLRAVTHVLIRRETALSARPRGGAAQTGRLAPGVLARIEKREGDFLRVRAGPAHGWIAADAAWGGARFAAPRN